MSVNHKIFRTANAARTAPDETETNVAQALIDLENNVPELKAELRPLQISAAREVDVRGGKKAIVVFVPVPQLKGFHKVQQRLTRELEKKFADRHVVFVGQRRVLPRPTRKSRSKQKRPRSRTLTDVHEKILEDLVFPTEIVGKRTRVAVDGSKQLKVFLDSKDATSLEYKLDSFSSVYRRLTGKEVVFEFPAVLQEALFALFSLSATSPSFPLLSAQWPQGPPMESHPVLCSLPAYDHGIDSKIVIMGNSGVGKTSLLQRYTHNKFDPKNTTSTSGAFFVTKKVYVNGLKVRLQLWDTAGQERFRSMAPMYYRGANAALVLYDITNASTFNDIRGWLQELKKNCPPELLIYIVGAKADLACQRQVTSDLARLSLHDWFPPPKPPPPPPPPPPAPSALSYIRPRFTSFPGLRSPPSASPSPTSPASPDTSPYLDLPPTRSSALQQSRTSLQARPRTAGIPNRSNASTPLSRTPQSCRFGSHFSAQPGLWSDSGDGSSNSIGEADEEAVEDESNYEWGLAKGMELFEVSAKDDIGIQSLFNHLISAIILRKDVIERENELKKRDSVYLTGIKAPAWAAQAEEEEARENARRSGGWSCC
ncbi:hypothetical protein APHAL10511_002051 [Amanita phalloides]|nr:hypothetical protein APHAL10511_002051 [Amanita phalloides]